MTKRFMLLITTMMMTTLSTQASEAPVKTEFTVTQVALDAANAKAAKELTEEDASGSVEETQPKGGETEKQ